MTGMYQRLRLLRFAAPAVRANSLIAALSSASTEECDTLVSEVLTTARGRRRPRLLAAALGAWDRLSEDARVALLGACGDALPDLLLDMGRSEHAVWRRAACDIACAEIHRAGSRRATFPGKLDRFAELAERIQDEDADVVHAAGRLARVLAGQLASPGHEKAFLRLDEMLASVVSDGAHRPPAAVLEAIAELAHRPGPRIESWLGDMSQAGHLVLRRAVREVPIERAASRLIPWMGLPAIAGIAVERVTELRTPTDWRAFLSTTYLLRARGRRSLLRRLKLNDKAMPSDEIRAELDLRSRLGLTRWIEMMPAPDRLRASQLAGFLTDPSADIRLRCVLALRDGVCLEESAGALVDYCFDSEAAVALAACEALAEADVRSRADLAGHWKRLTRSPHSAVRLLARERLSRSVLAPEAGGGGYAAFRLRLSEDRPAAIQRLRSELNSTVPQRAARAIALVRRFALAPDVELELLAIAAGTDDRLAAGAVRTLGVRGASDAAMQVIERLTEHHDARVRANAVEALLELRPDDPRAVEWRRHDDARLRLNAIRSSMGEAAGERVPEDLAEMLGDPRPSHRRAALWLTQRLRLTGLAGRVADLTHLDESGEVRSEAQACGEVLLAEMRAGWSGSKMESAGAGAGIDATPSRQMGWVH